MTLTRSTVSGNRSRSLGGGIDNGTGGTLTLIHSTISGNRTTLGGGGLVSWGPLTITNSTISDNIAYYAGGVLNHHAADVTHSTFSDNHANWGGGISNFAPLTITNSTFSGNSAGVHSGGIDNTAGGTLTVIHSTFTGNSAPTGGGIYNQGSTVTIRHSIIANSPSGGNCDGWGTINDAGYNLDSESTCGFSAVGSLSNTAPLLGPLANNGGPTRTHALLEGSPAINGGDPAFQPGSVLWDQRGAGFPRRVGARIDIGAVERRGQP